MWAKASVMRRMRLVGEKKDALSSLQFRGSGKGVDEVRFFHTALR